MALTIAQLANLGLTANQQNKLALFQTIGNTLRPAGGGGPPDLSGVTLSMSKTVLNFLNDLRALESQMRRGAEYARDKFLADAAKTADDAAPAGTL